MSSYYDETPTCSCTGKIGCLRRSPQGFARGTPAFHDAFVDEPYPQPSMPRVTVTRRLQFNAAHRLHNPNLTESENKALFGLCNNPNWHGHNYRLDVSVQGEVDPRTGYVIDLKILRELVDAALIDHMDHKNLNLDVDFMRGINPTAENIVLACWRVLAPAVHPGRLIRLRLWETDNNYVEYEGE